MNEYLVISALGKDRPGIVNDISMAILDADCNIIDSRMTVLGGEFAVILSVSGSAKDIERLEKDIPGLQEIFKLTIISKRTGQKAAQSDLLPYAARAVCIDHPGIVHQIANFFSSRNINIENLATNRYAAAHTGTAMFSIDMIVNVSPSIDIDELRNQFIRFCDEMNIDAVLEPVKS